MPMSALVGDCGDIWGQHPGCWLQIFVLRLGSPWHELPGLPQSTLTSNFACPSVRTLVFCRSVRTTQRNIRFYYPLPTPRVALPVGGDSWQEDQLPASSTALQASGVMAGTSWAFIAWVTVLSPENKRKKERKMPKSMPLADHLITRSN